MRPLPCVLGHEWQKRREPLTPPSSPSAERAGAPSRRLACRVPPAGARIVRIQSLDPEAPELRWFVWSECSRCQAPAPEIAPRPARERSAPAYAELAEA